MRRPKVIRLGYPVLTLAMLTLVASAASGHEPNQYIWGHWRDANDTSSNQGNGVADISYHFKSAVPSGKRARISDGIEKWEGLGDIPTSWSAAQDTGGGFSSECYEYADRFSVINYGDFTLNPELNPDALAVTSVCRYPNEPNSLRNFVMWFRSDVAWYSGSDGTVPEGKVDLLSIATHEAGHAAGYLLGDVEQPDSEDRRPLQ